MFFANNEVENVNQRMATRGKVHDGSQRDNFDRFSKYRIASVATNLLSRAARSERNHVCVVSTHVKPLVVPVKVSASALVIVVINDVLINVENYWE